MILEIDRFSNYSFTPLLQIAETVRKLEKPSIQIQSLTPETGWTCTINIQGPPDTQFESTGESMTITKGI